MINCLITAAIGIIYGVYGQVSDILSNDVYQALSIMGEGILGIFVTLGIIALIVLLLNKIGGKQ